MTYEGGRIRSDFEQHPGMARAAYDLARRQHAMGRRVDATQIAEQLREQGFTTSRQTVDRWLRRRYPELFDGPPYTTR